MAGPDYRRALDALESEYGAAPPPDVSGLSLDPTALQAELDRAIAARSPAAAAPPVPPTPPVQLDPGMLQAELDSAIAARQAPAASPAPTLPTEVLPAAALAPKSLPGAAAPPPAPSPPSPAAAAAPGPAAPAASPLPPLDLPRTPGLQVDPRIAQYEAEAAQLGRGDKLQRILAGVGGLVAGLATEGRAGGQAFDTYQRFAAMDEAKAQRLRQLADAMRERGLLQQRQATADAQRDFENRRTLRQDESAASRAAAQEGRAAAEETRAGEIHKARLGDIDRSRTAEAAAKEPLRDDQLAGLRKLGMPAEMLVGLTQGDLKDMREMGFEAWAARDRARIQAAGQAARNVVVAPPSTAQSDVLLEQLGESATPADRALIQELATTSDPKRRAEINALVKQRGDTVRQQQAVTTAQKTKADEQQQKRLKEYTDKRFAIKLPEAEAALQHVKDILSQGNEGRGLKPGDDLPGFGQLAGRLPDVAVSDQGENLRQAHGQLRSMLLNALSGAGVPNAERAYYDNLMGAAGGSENKFWQGLQMVEKRLQRLDNELRTGFGLEGARAGAGTRKAAGGGAAPAPAPKTGGPRTRTGTDPQGNPVTFELGQDGRPTAAVYSDGRRVTF